MRLAIDTTCTNDAVASTTPFGVPVAIELH